MGITITDVKVVGACRKHDTNKEYLKTPEKDIYCIECSFKPEEKPNLFSKGKPILNYAEFLLSLGKEDSKKPTLLEWLEEEYKELAKHPSYQNAERLDVIITIMKKIKSGDFRGLM